MAPVVRELVDFFAQQENSKLPVKGLKLPDNDGVAKSLLHGVAEYARTVCRWINMFID